MLFAPSRSLRLIPPILFPLGIYIGSTVLYWATMNGVAPPLISIYLLYGVALGIAFGHKKISPFFLVCAIAAVGIAGLRNYQTISYYHSFPFHITQHGATMRGKLINYSYNQTSRFSHCHTIALESILSNAQTITTRYTIQLYTQKQLNAEIGDTIELEDICLKRPKDDDFYRHLMKEGIAATAFTQRQSIIIISRNIFSPMRMLFNVRKRIIDSFKATTNAQTFAFFSAIFLGEKTALKKESALENPFKQWGVVHYLARSGLHLVIIVSLCGALFQWIPIGLFYKQILLMILIAIYAMLSWTSISFLRALTIFFFYSICLLFRVPHHLMQLLLLCCFLFLLINPLYIFFLDFQLSFGLTFALAWLNLFKIDNEICSE